MTYRILDGNELVVQGGLEAGFSLYTGYPGSPLADYFNVLQRRRDVLREHGVRVAIANSEGNAASMAAGAKQAGRNCLVAMKSMGLHVAADALSVGNFANPGRPGPGSGTGGDERAGVVVVVGDDPWSMSTATPADSRYLFKHLHIPFLEPATPQELKDWIGHALALSRRTSLYCGVVLTTFLAEGGGRVELGDRAPVPAERTRLKAADFDLARGVMVPPNSLNADGEMIRERFPRAQRVLAQLKLDRIHGNRGARIGFIASGAAFETLREVMEDIGLLESVSLYKPASSYPLVSEPLLGWLRGLERVVVVEEKRGFLETELTAFCHEHDVPARIMGKRFVAGRRRIEGFPAYGGLSYEIIRDKLGRLADLLPPGHGGFGPAFCAPRLNTPVPQRLPTFCAGCPHRETLSLLKDLRATLEAEGVDLLAHGDVGCYSLAFLPPFGEMHNIGAMGQGGSVGAGVDTFSDNPSVVLMGDSTLFHTGLTSISNSVQLGHDVTYIVLDNDVTAMTGHQVTPHTGRSVEGQARPRQDILALVRSLGVSAAIEVNPSDRYFYRNVLADHVRRSGTKVIVSRKECGLTYHARMRARDRELFRAGGVKPEQTFFRINTSACEDCRACLEATGCPGLSRVEDPYGPKMLIDPQVCVSDGYCTRIMACPSFEQVTVTDFHPTRYRSLPAVGGEEALPVPRERKTLADIAAGNRWRVVVTGVGGSGVTTISRVLAEAAEEMNGVSGLGFRFVDQKGLAQRNGRVTGHLSVFPEGRAAGPITPRGSADLVLSPDLLDGSQAVEFLAPHGQAMLDRNFQVPLSVMLDRGEEGPAMTAETLRRELSTTLPGRVTFADTRALCQRIMGKSVYASAVLLGMAFQAGTLPFTVENMRDAFARSVPAAELDSNWQAFVLGRRLVHEGVDAVTTAFAGPAKPNDAVLLRESVAQSVPPFGRAGPLLRRFDDGVAVLARLYPEMPAGHHARYIHDLMVYDRGARLDAFLLEAGDLRSLYRDPECRRIALRILARTYFIKDEIFVAHQLVSPVERARRENAYGGLGTGYRIRHLNRPRFELLGHKLELDLRPYPWMLRIVRHLRFLRALMPGVHRCDRVIAARIRQELLEVIPATGGDTRKRLMRLDSIKGYRDVRYQRAEAVLADMPNPRPGRGAQRAGLQPGPRLRRSR